MNSRIFMTFVIAVYCAQLYSQAQKTDITLSDEMIMEFWHSGKTLPVEMTRRYPWPDLGLKNDNGINVFVDIAHQCSFPNRICRCANCFAYCPNRTYSCRKCESRRYRRLHITVRTKKIIHHQYKFLCGCPATFSLFFSNHKKNCKFAFPKILESLNF